MSRTTIDYRPGELLLAAHRRRGPVIRVGTGRHGLVYLLGPEANAFVMAHDELFRVREAMAGLIPVDGETALVVSDGPDHTRRRAVVRPAMHRRQIDSYVTTLAACADDALDAALAAAGPGGTFDAYEVFRAAIRRSTILSLFGPRLAARTDELGADLQPLLELVDHMATIPARQRLGTPLWRRAMAARGRIDAVIYAEIDRVRADPEAAAEMGVLATLVHGRDGNGSGLSDLEVRDQVVSLIAAGYETTSAALAWTVFSLGGHPDVLARVREEVETVTAGAPPAAADLPRLALLGACVTESLRLYPPAVVSGRHVATGFEFAGRHVPAGVLLLYSPYVTHRDPELYDAPREFRPERWLDGTRRPASEYLPFGGGIHRCIGSTMATTEITVMLARLLTRTSFTLPDRRVRGRSFAALRPRGGMPVTLAG